MNTARLAVLSACLLAGAGCTEQTDPSGRATFSTPSLGQMLGLGQPQAPTQLASAGPSASGAEHYQQQLDGKITDLTLTSAGPGEWLVDASMKLDRPLCIGSVSGRAVETSPGLLVMKTDNQGNRCSLQIRRSAAGVSLGELDCVTDHGASCEFSADMTRVD